MQSLRIGFEWSPFPEVLELVNDVRAYPSWRRAFVEHDLLRSPGSGAGVDHFTVLRLAHGQRDPDYVVSHSCCPANHHRWADFRAEILHPDDRRFNAASAKPVLEPRGVRRDLEACFL